MPSQPTLSLQIWFQGLLTLIIRILHVVKAKIDLYLQLRTLICRNFYKQRKIVDWELPFFLSRLTLSLDFWWFTDKKSQYLLWQVRPGDNPHSRHLTVFDTLLTFPSHYIHNPRFLCRELWIQESLTTLPVKFNFTGTGTLSMTNFVSLSNGLVLMSISNQLWVSTHSQLQFPLTHAFFLLLLLLFFLGFVGHQLYR